jgi:hypothetical protein
MTGNLGRKKVDPSTPSLRVPRILPRHALNPGGIGTAQSPAVGASCHFRLDIVIAFGRWILAALGRIALVVTIGSGIVVTLGRIVVIGSWIVAIRGRLRIVAIRRWMVGVCGWCVVAIAGRVVSIRHGIAVARYTDRLLDQVAAPRQDLLLRQQGGYGRVHEGPDDQSREGAGLLLKEASRVGYR